jgi:hypothetical protein
VPDEIWAAVARAGELSAAGDERGALALYTRALADTRAAAGDAYLLFQLHWGAAGVLEALGEDVAAADQLRAAAAEAEGMYVTFAARRVARHALREKHAIVLDRLAALEWGDLPAARRGLDDAIAHAEAAVGTSDSARLTLAGARGMHVRTLRRGG